MDPPLDWNGTPSRLRQPLPRPRHAILFLPLRFASLRFFLPHVQNPPSPPRAATYRSPSSLSLSSPRGGGVRRELSASLLAPAAAVAMEVPISGGGGGERFCHAAQVVGADGEMDGEAMARFAAGAGLLGRGLSYAVVSIVGPQGSGERTLPPPSSSSHDHQFTTPPSPCREQSSLLVLDACCVVDGISRLDDASSIFCCGSVFIFFCTDFLLDMFVLVIWIIIW